MPRKHPIIAVTGSSGAGTTSVQHAFAEIFRRLHIKNVADVHGDAFFRYNRDDMEAAIDTSIAEDKPISHFGPEANLFEELQELFRQYSATGSGKIRHYVKDYEDAARLQAPIGEFTRLGHTVLRGPARRCGFFHLDPAPHQPRSSRDASARATPRTTRC